MDIIKFRVWDNERQEYLDTDILHVKNDGTLLISKKGEYMGVVEWADGLASFGLRLVKDNILYTFPVLDITGADLDTLEVVGNVHHNRELLKDGVL